MSATAESSVLHCHRDNQQRDGVDDSVHQHADREIAAPEVQQSDHGARDSGEGSARDICLNFGIHLEHACGGNNACTTCHVIVKNGYDNLSEKDDDEADRLDMAAGLTLRSRLGCQCVVEGDVVVEIPLWNRNYVSEGGGSMNLGDAIPVGKR